MAGGLGKASVNKCQQPPHGKDHLKRVKELQESRKQRGLKEERGCRTGLLEMDRLGDDRDNSSNPSSITK